MEWSLYGTDGTVFTVELSEYEDVPEVIYCANRVFYYSEKSGNYLETVPANLTAIKITARSPAVG
jgi:hypothetical protein